MYMNLELAPAGAVSRPTDNQPPVPIGVEERLAMLVEGRSLPRDGARDLFSRIVAGEVAEPLIAALLTAFRMKGESAEELAGAALALRAADAPFPRPDYLFADCCGTGGDASASVNLSTAVAFVAAAAGLPVAKHGNRSFSSLCGSADVLEALGVRLDAPPETSRRALDELGICFLFAPSFHPGLRHAGPARRALRLRTIMNLLGPCVNPAEPPVQLLGVADPALLDRIAHVLLALGVERALIVHGDGLDEVALHGETQAVRIIAGEVERLVLTPEQAGFERVPVADLVGGGRDENAQRLAAILAGRGNLTENDAVAINAGALLMTAGLAADLREGSDLALQALASGRPARLLAGLVEISRG
jgi:anthranilate phosphoribosyltransferase